jgi:dihydrofolate reductase
MLARFGELAMLEHPPACAEECAVGAVYAIRTRWPMSEAIMATMQASGMIPHGNGRSESRHVDSARRASTYPIERAHCVSARSPDKKPAEEPGMAKVIVSLAASLDGFIAGPNDGADNPLGDGGMRLFDWYFDGDTPSRPYQDAASRGVPVPPFKLSRTSAELFDELIESCGAVVTGRRTYDITNGWGGNGPTPGLPLFIVTHNVPEHVPQGVEGTRYTFITDGVESAIAQAKEVAGEKYVSLVGAAVPQACLRLGLLDEIQIHLVPVLLGGGVSLFGRLGIGKIDLENIRVVDAPGVTHLRYRVISRPNRG